MQLQDPAVPHKHPLLACQVAKLPIAMQNSRPDCFSAVTANDRRLQVLSWLSSVRNDTASTIKLLCDGKGGNSAEAATTEYATSDGCRRDIWFDDTLHTLREGYSEGCAGDATSQMHSSPSAAPDASRLGLKLLNSKPLTCDKNTAQSLACQEVRSELL